MRALSRVLAGAAVALVTAATCLAADEPSRAGPIEQRITPCRIAKLNPRQGPPCEPPALSTSQDPDERAAAHLRRASFFLEVFEFNSARTEIDAGLAIAPNDFELRLLSARVAITMHDSSGLDTATAERDLSIALKLNPTDPDARATFVDFMGTRATPEMRRREYDFILALHPRHVYSRKARARMLQELGRHREALEDFDVVLSMEPDNARYLERRAVSHLALNDPEAAAADLSHALRLDPRNIILRTARATAYELAGEDEKALADYDAILGPTGGPLKSALGGDRLGKYRMQRALVLVRLMKLDQAAVEMASGLAEGKSTILRAQVFLRQSGFPLLPLDGRDSPELRQALRECFGMKMCFQEIRRIAL